MKKLNKKTLKIIAATSMCIFTLFSVFSASVAWFNLLVQDDASASGLDIVNEGLHFSSLSIHKCNLAESNSSSLVFFEEVAGGVTIDNEGNTHYVSDTVTIDDYSALNRTQPVLFLFTVKEGTLDKDILIKAKTSTTTPLSVVSQINDNPLSSVVQFRSSSYTADNFSFNISVSSLGEISRFVKMNSSETAWASQDNFAQEISLYVGSTQEETKYVAIVMDYYDSALELLTSLNLANEVLVSSNSRIGFKCDWTMVI